MYHQQGVVVQSTLVQQASKQLSKYEILILVYLGSIQRSVFYRSCLQGYPSISTPEYIHSPRTPYRRGISSVIPRKTDTLSRPQVSLSIHAQIDTQIHRYMHARICKGSLSVLLNWTVSTGPPWRQRTAQCLYRCIRVIDCILCMLCVNGVLSELACVLRASQGFANTTPYMQGNENHLKAKMDGEEFLLLYHGLLLTTTWCVVNPEM